MNVVHCTFCLCFYAGIYIPCKAVGRLVNIHFHFQSYLLNLLSHPYMIQFFVAKPYEAHLLLFDANPIKQIYNSLLQIDRKSVV